MSKIKLIKDTFSETFKQKDIKKSAFLHLSFLGTLLLQNISNHYDKRNELLEKKYQNPPKTIAVNMVSHQQYQEITSGKMIYQQYHQDDNIVNEIKNVIKETKEITKNIVKEDIVNKTASKPLMPTMENKKITSAKKINNKQNEINKFKQTQQRKIEEARKIEEQKKIEQLEKEERERQINMEIDGVINSIYSGNALSNNYRPSTQYMKDNKTQVQNIIETQIEKCWSNYSRGKNWNQIVVKILAYYNNNGHLNGFTDITEQQMKTGEYYNMARDARLALQECSPLSNIEEFPYENWKEITFSFRYY